MKIKNLLYTFILGVTTLTGCQSALVWDEVPESVYSNLELSGAMVRNRPRELFVKKVWQVNHNDGKGQWLDNYLARSVMDAIENGIEYTNNTGAPITILDKTLSAGETMTVKNTKEIVDDSSAPEGKKHIIHVFTLDKVEYITPNKGHLFVQSAFDSESVKPNAYFEEVEEGKFRSVIMPVKINEMVLEFILDDQAAGKVEPVNGAPNLGVPGDFTQPRQYILTNTALRPDGAPEYKRLYEIQVHVLPVTPDEAYKWSEGSI
ncbi:MAG: DUF5018-related domain-containing protein [Parabacteroides gordonii]|uniref:DUF5018-related domain-containing protein n=1 Tax=Parabacteroides gordonii TaxID=574930 RepID=UPI003A8A597D